MTFIWLLVWLVQGTPDVDFHNTWNDWAVWLVVCLAVDIFGGSSKL